MYTPRCQCGGHHWWCNDCGEENCTRRDGEFCWWCGTVRWESSTGRFIKDSMQAEAREELGGA